MGWPRVVSGNQGDVEVMAIACRAAKLKWRTQTESNRMSRLARLTPLTVRLGNAIGMLFIIASLQGCGTLYVLKEIEHYRLVKRARAEVDREIRARPVGDPGPTATVAMFPLGGSPGESVEQSRTDSARCEIDARSAVWTSWTSRTSGDAARFRLATERYVRCMAAQGYRCANRVDHHACAAAWAHPTATRTQLLQDAWECKRPWRTTIALGSTLWARYLECMKSHGYRPDVSETGERKP
jgi:hypothetical protein